MAFSSLKIPTALVLIAAFLSACGGANNGVGPPPNPNGNTSAGQGPPITSQLLYVPNCCLNLIATVTAYSLNADGNEAPVKTLGATNGDPTTLLNGPQSVAFDSAGNMYVVNRDPCGTCGGAHITVYAPGATDNAVPIRDICIPNTDLFTGARGIALDRHDNIYVTNETFNAVIVFAAGANGNATPTAVITGPHTELSLPAGIAVDDVGNIYVANRGGQNGNTGVTIYAPGSTGDATPIRNILSGLNAGASGVALDAKDNLYVVGGASNRYPPNAPYVNVYASGSSLPSAVIKGPASGMDIPVGIALGSSGEIFVSNGVCGPCSIVVYAAGANGNVSPVRTIIGNDTGLSFPGFIAIH